MSAAVNTAEYLDAVRATARARFEAKMRLVRELTRGVRPTLSTMKADLDPPPVKP